MENIINLINFEEHLNYVIIYKQRYSKKNLVHQQIFKFHYNIQVYKLFKKITEFKN